MQASAVLCREQGGTFTIEDIEIGEPRDDEVLVRVVAAGVCHTDLICRDQWYPVPLPSVFGHEGAGVMEAVGSHVRKVAPGDHVVLTKTYPMGEVNKAAHDTESGETVKPILVM